MTPWGWVLLAIATAVVLLVLTALAVGWRLARHFLVPRPYALLPEFRVIDATPGRVALAAPSPAAGGAPPALPGGPPRSRLPGVPARFPSLDPRRAGTFGLLWEGGHGVLGRVVQDDGAVVVRELELVEGRPPAPAEPARFDAFVFRRDPARDRGLPFEDVVVPSDAGALAAWWLPGGGDVGVLMLHGRRRGARIETLRALPAVASEGRSVLCLAYRNHDASPMSPDGLYHYGATEVRDALAGLAFLWSRGVRRTVLFGISMGGTIALEAVKRWPAPNGGEAAPELRGVVLDAPLIDPAAAVRWAARAAGVPAATADLALLVASWRAHIRWTALDQRRSAAQIPAPVLLFAGVADRTVPIALVDGFAVRLRSPVRYVRLDGVEHAEAWNDDPAAYEHEVRAFLSDVTRT